MRRFARVRGGDAEQRVAAFLPSNYEVIGTAEDGAVLIGGADVAGWTLDGYVLPRLASGLLFGDELVAGVDHEVSGCPICGEADWRSGDEARR